jgi:hypothetical protein
MVIFLKMSIPVIYGEDDTAVIAMIQPSLHANYKPTY